MRASIILPLGLCLGQAYSNIIFTPVDLSCDTESPNYTGCFRGMHCVEGE